MITSSPLHGDSTFTYAIPRDQNGRAWTVAEVDHVDIFAFAPGSRASFWESLAVPTADVMSDAGFDDEGWPYEGKPTFRHELPYGVGANPYYPPFGAVRLEFVLWLLDGSGNPRGRQTLVHEATYQHTRATSGGVV